jgi:hypothetical protein
MTREFKGTSQFAVMVEDLPLSARISLALLAADLALPHLQRSPDIHLAREALNSALNWHQGKPVDLARWEDVLEAEETSLAFASGRAEARSKEEYLAWVLLGNAIDYVAYRAFVAENRIPQTSLDNIDDRQLDTVDRDLRALDPSAMTLMTRAAAYLKQHPDIHLAQLKAQMLKG